MKRQGQVDNPSFIPAHQDDGVGVIEGVALDTTMTKSDSDSEWEREREEDSPHTVEEEEGDKKQEEMEESG